MSLLERLWAQTARFRGQTELPFKFNECEIVVISFPKCGRTWLRVLLGWTFQRHFAQPEISFHEQIFGGTAPGMPRVAFTHDGRPVFKRASQLEKSKEKYRDKKIVLLVRDPRDALVSLHFQIIRRKRGNKRRPLEQVTLSEYLRQPIGSLDTFLEYYKIWDAQRHVPTAFLLVRYEDMHVDTTRELRRVLDFVGVGDVSQAMMEDVVASASFEKMHEMEARGEFASRKLTPGNLADPESYKTRRGRVGGFVDYLTPADIEYLNQRIRTEFPAYYGYQV